MIKISVTFKYSYASLHPFLILKIKKLSQNWIEIFHSRRIIFKNELIYLYDYYTFYFNLIHTIADCQRDKMIFLSVLNGFEDK